jgi:hypothetical protein
MNHPKVIPGHRSVSLSAIATMVAEAPILVALPIHPSAARLPHGFERVDITILDWIVAARVVHRPLSFAN